MSERDRFTPFGYLTSVSQPAISFEHVVSEARLPRLDFVDRWFRDHLEIRESLSRDHLESFSHVLAVGWRTLQLYGEVLRAGWVPVFAMGEVRAGPPSEGRPTIRVDLPVCDGFAAASFADLYRRCLRLVCEDFAQEPEKASIARVHEGIDGLIKIIRRGNPLGNSAMAMGRIAHVAGIPFRHVGGGVMQFGWGSKARFMRHALIGTDSAVGAGISRSKQYSANLLKTAGFPAPRNALVGSFEDALRQANALGWPVAVKPNDLACSDGVSIDVANEAQLAQAFAHARSKSPNVLVEKQIEGVCHRLMIVGGELAYAVRRHPKAVVGDGNSSVRALVAQGDAKEARRPPWLRLKPFSIDAEVSRTLAKIGFDLDSIPARGAIIPLRLFNSHEFGGIVEDVQPTIHPDNVRLASDVASLFGLEIAGIDLMSKDVAVPWHENGGVILEVNSGPDFMEASRKIRQTCVTPVLADGDGRIPVHWMTGQGDLSARARIEAARLAAQGQPCHVLGDTYHFDEAGNEQQLAVCGLMKRTLALLARTRVDALLIVDDASAFVRNGFPVDRLETAYIVSSSETEAAAIQTALSSRISVQKVELLSGENPALPN